MSTLDDQRAITRIALAEVSGPGFALAGSAAIREHGIISRPTEDVDLFTSRLDQGEFAASVERVAGALSEHGYEVEQVRRSPQFARLRVQTPGGVLVDVDMGMDWRAKEPVTLDVGPVLSLEDAVGNKVSALYSRGETRDFLDVDAIRQAGVYTDEQLIAAALERDPGFEVEMFAHQLQRVGRLQRAQVARYGMDEAKLEAVKERLGQWAAQLRHEQGRPGSSEPTQTLLRASFPHDPGPAVEGAPLAPRTARGASAPGRDGLER